MSIIRTSIIGLVSLLFLIFFVSLIDQIVRIIKKGQIQRKKKIGIGTHGKEKDLSQCLRRINSFVVGWSDNRVGQVLRIDIDSAES
jgi:hypothetical protein